MLVNTPPHEFGVNVPVAMAAARTSSYAAYAWPGPLAGLFHRNGMIVSMAMAIGLAVTGADAGDDCTGFVWGVHIVPGLFKVMPHTIMAAIPLGIGIFIGHGLAPLLATCLRGVGGWRSLFDAVSAVAALRHLGGETAASWRVGLSVYI